MKIIKLSLVLAIIYMINSLCQASETPVESRKNKRALSLSSSSKTNEIDEDFSEPLNGHSVSAPSYYSESEITEIINEIKASPKKNYLKDSLAVRSALCEEIRNGNTKVIEMFRSKVKELDPSKIRDSKHKSYSFYYNASLNKVIAQGSNPK